MKTTKKITLALGLLLAGAGFAQTTATRSGNGLLGQRYAEFGVGLQDLKFISDHAYSFGATANTPLAPSGLDAGIGYSHAWVDGQIDGHANTFGGYLTAYVPLHDVKPFLSAGVGWEWTRFRRFGDDDQGLWNLAAGVEIPLGAITLTPRVSYADDFEGRFSSDQQWTYEVEGNCWINAKTAVFGSVGKTDVVRSPAEAWNYRLGVRVRF